MTHKKNTTLSTGCLQVSSRSGFAIIILSIFLILSGCATSSNHAPVYSRLPPPTTKVSTHVVAPGETLYSIAWRYGMDYKALARANNIDSLYTIFPGQIIQLKESSQPVYEESQPVSRGNDSVTKSPAPRTLNSRNDQKAISSKSNVNTPIIKANSSARSENKSSQMQTAVPLTTISENPVWRWPANGRVITNFSGATSLKRGIDIEGKKGDSVNAAAAGQVVYAGSGLRGYGKLVIIKHSEKYLSAYAHNHRIRVQEGDFVESGQRIADIGSTGTGTKGKPKLHFQIRQNGQSVDPIKLLPKRKP